MDINLLIVIIVAICCFVGLSTALTQQLIQYKLKKEQIKADVMIKTEEINAKNRLEIEQLMVSGKTSGTASYKNNDVLSEDNRTVREKIRE